MIGTGDPASRLSFIFTIFDKNNDDKLDNEEITNVVVRMNVVAESLGRAGTKTTQFIDGLLFKLDGNDDGIVTKKEWVEKGATSPSLLVLLGLDVKK